MTTFMPDGPVHQLELVPLGEGAWRLCDRNVQEDDPASVMAYVEQSEEFLEVVWLHGRLGWARFTCLTEVLEAAAAELAPTPAHRARRPVDIPHFAPRLSPH
ncbi:hypothetical protein G5T42_03485 [Microbacterium sp. 4R-513]|uniref:hypothetical protein n=1 Tax=Microbacterium sp. 4R-513 TaxID=2567934 RepID=UPI0013E18B94|nr:hypothetical protein [Microbacterium sp. 4R-513]QIG38661.1 hypothetical protein G5T42_03485 [Microbacterium sp. 4R-513]